MYLVFALQTDGLNTKTTPVLRVFHAKTDLGRHEMTKHCDTDTLHSINKSIANDGAHSSAEHKLCPTAPRAASPSPDIDHADELPGEVAQGEGVQPEGDHPEQHL